MFNFGTFFLWALSACILWRGSLAEDVQSHFVCLLDNPSPNQCDSFCLNELRPLLNQVIKGQDQGKETKAELESLVGQLVKSEGQIQEVKTKLEAKLKAPLQSVLTRMAESQAKLEGNLLEVLASLQTQLQATVNKIAN